jgi:hypothetical protein
VDYPRVSLASEFRIGSSPEFCVFGAISLIIARSQSLVHILLAFAAIAVAVETASGKLAGGYRRDQRDRICPRYLLWRCPRGNWPGTVQHRRSAAVCLCRDLPVHGCEPSPPRRTLSRIHLQSDSAGQEGSGLHMGHPHKMLVQWPYCYSYLAKKKGRRG